jgi:hypothetical protein
MTRMKLTMKPLAAGDGPLKMQPDGPDYWCSRVSPCAAYLTRKWTAPVTKTDRHTGEAKTFMATASETLAVSLTAALWREA